MIYYRLTDPGKNGTITRAEGRSQQQYVAGKGWVESGVMIRYFWPEDELFEQYVVITEAEAMKIVGEKSA